MTDKAPVLIHGATGFTGSLVCEAVAARGLRYAIGGRSRQRLERLRERLRASGRRPPEEVVAIDLASGDAVRDAVAGRTIVLACAGPFVAVGEPVLAACARLGVHYADTTVEQRFVLDAQRRYQPTAERSGACVVPAMAYESAPADWAMHLAAEEAGGAPDAVEVLYAHGGRGGYAAATTRGTKKSVLRALAEPEPLQWVDGALVVEAAGEIVTTFELPSGRRVTGVSFPSPEAIVTPPHTGARTVRTYVAMGRRTAWMLHRLRRVAPGALRAAMPAIDRAAERGRRGPSTSARTEARFVVLAEARKGSACVRVALTGVDPYGLTAQIQAYAASRAVGGEIRARGVVAPSVAFAPNDALAALAPHGLDRVGRG
jgi:short subunit dehydrogenase-like uncharacterized protein